MAKHPPTIFWHDYETWGATPQKDRPSQFAGVRTDLDLNIIGEPVTLYCQPADDYLPHPQACLITGITPQHATKHGVVEAEFFQKIHQELSQPNSCVAGYNSIRFDDEVTRYGFYRNFYDPYAREWQNGNTRWDIIDMVRACYALRPEGIEWPTHEDGRPSFKLEDLTKANGIAHESAHDAMSDVYATIAMAKLIKEKQPKLYDFLFQLRQKGKVSELIDVYQMTPLVHVSSKLPSQNGCTTWVAPLSYHPDNKNAVICFNLNYNPQLLLDLSVEEIIERLYTPMDELPDPEERIGLKLVHINKCPVLAPAKTLLPENAQRLGIDRERCLKHLQVLQAHSQIREIVAQVYQQQKDYPATENVDYQLYDGFFSPADKEQMERIRNCPPEALGQLTLDFTDPRLEKLFLRYKARNYPGTLTIEESNVWQAYRKAKLMDGEDSPNLTMADFTMELENLVHEYESDAHKMGILKALFQYASEL
ncbi:exodeoxyribonuclease I [Algicola sagamiensis]|uniref:exodeoxyribonuclease I n=1 Tax=Algicola sagamiensis TaxID=163869 RepID=UPI0003644CCA|nr:exodeoxyribonuclease I [Algicola sagamiensis]